MHLVSDRTSIYWDGHTHTHGILATDTGRRGQIAPTRAATRRSPRLPDAGLWLSRQRHFCVFAVSFPGQDALTTIYNTILSQHLAYRSAPLVVQRMSGQLVASALGKPWPPPLVGRTAALTGLVAALSSLVNVFCTLQSVSLNDAVSTGDAVRSDWGGWGEESGHRSDVHVARAAGFLPLRCRVLKLPLARSAFALGAVP